MWWHLENDTLLSCIHCKYHTWSHCPIIISHLSLFAIILSLTKNTKLRGGRGEDEEKEKEGGRRWRTTRRQHRRGGDAGAAMDREEGWAADDGPRGSLFEIVSDMGTQRGIDSVGSLATFLSAELEGDLRCGDGGRRRVDNGTNGNNGNEGGRRQWRLCRLRGIRCTRSGGSGGRVWYFEVDNRSRCDRPQVGGHRWKHTKLPNSGQGPLKQTKIGEVTECDTQTAARRNVWYFDYQWCIGVIKWIEKKTRCIIITTALKQNICIFYQRFDQKMVFLKPRLLEAGRNGHGCCCGSMPTEPVLSELSSTSAVWSILRPWRCPKSPQKPPESTTCRGIHQKKRKGRKSLFYLRHNF